MSFIAFALMLNAIELRIFEKLFTTFEKLFITLAIGFADFSKISPRPDIIDPKPSKGATKESRIPISFFTIIKRTMLTPPANILLQSKLPNASMIDDPISFMVSQILDAPVLIPLIKPSIMFVPTAYISVDGE